MWRGRDGAARGSLWEQGGKGSGRGVKSPDSGRKAEANEQITSGRADSRTCINHCDHPQSSPRFPSGALSPLTANSNALFPVTYLHGFQVSPIFQGSLHFK